MDSYSVEDVSGLLLVLALDAALPVSIVALLLGVIVNGIHQVLQVLGNEWIHAQVQHVKAGGQDRALGGGVVLVGVQVGVRNLKGLVRGLELVKESVQEGSVADGDGELLKDVGEGQLGLGQSLGGELLFLVQLHEGGGEAKSTEVEVAHGRASDIYVIIRAKKNSI